MKQQWPGRHDQLAARPHRPDILDALIDTHNLSPTSRRAVQGQSLRLAVSSRLDGETHTIWRRDSLYAARERYATPSVVCIVHVCIDYIMRQAARESRAPSQHSSATDHYTPLRSKDMIAREDIYICKE